jgi:Fe-S oxidoreductase
VPDAPVCCGRPYYDFGWLEPAQRALENTLEVLAEPLAAGLPIVVLEPSCASVFHDELQRLFPARDDAAALGRQSFLLGDFLARHAPGYRPPPLSGRHALLHGHCHQQALSGSGADLALLRAAGLEVETPDSGCCGLAGSFGYGRERYSVSMAIGERVLLPRVRQAADDTLVITNGYSCRQQIAHGAGRRAWHLAEVLAGHPAAATSGSGEAAAAPETPHGVGTAIGGGR